MDELLSFLTDANAAAAVRSRAAVAIASLAAGADGDSVTSAELLQHAPALLRALLAQLRGAGAGAAADAAPATATAPPTAAGCSPGIVASARGVGGARVVEGERGGGAHAETS